MRHDTEPQREPTRVLERGTATGETISTLFARPGMAPPLASPAAVHSDRATATGPIVLATRGLDDTDAAVRMAWRLAGRTNADVQVLSVLEPVAPLDVRFTTMPPPRSELLAAQRDEQLAQVHAQLCRATPASCAWPAAVADGAADEAIAQLAGEQAASLIVMGRGRHGRLARAAGADTALHVLRRTDVPVYAVDPGASELARRVVVAVDFSEYSLPAARVALALAAPDAVVTLAHVRPRVPAPMVALADWERTYDRAVRTLFDRLVEKLAAPASAVVEAVTLAGRTPAHALVDFATAWHADLMVCSTHGNGFFTRLVLGGVAAELLRTAPCSFLCVPAAVPAWPATAGVEELRLLRDEVPSVEWESAVNGFADRFRGRTCTTRATDEHGAARPDPGPGFLADVRYSPDGWVVRIVIGKPDAVREPHSVRITDVQGIQRLTEPGGAERGLRVLGSQGAVELRLP